MNTASLYDDEIEKRQHLNAIQSLARDLEIPMGVVSELYESELVNLKQVVRIKDFLTVIVSRRVKETIKKMITRGESLQNW
jgi:hypothetical protein